MKNIHVLPTAEEFLSKKFSEVKGSLSILDMQELMIDFGKLCAQAALEAAAEKAISENMVDNCDDHTPFWGACQSCGRTDNFKRFTKNTDRVVKSILNAFPLTNIK